MRRSLLMLAVFCVLTTTTREAHALTIMLQEASVGSTFPNGDTVQSANTACLFPSTGNYRAVIQAAANYWGTIYTLPYTITVTWGFATLASNVNARSNGTHLQASGAGAGIIDQGFLEINRSNNACFYIDSNTNTYSEYPSGRSTSEQIPYFNQPGKTVEVGRWTDVSTSGNTTHQDLFYTVLHELGHILGLAPFTYRYSNEVTDGDIDVTSPRPCPSLSWMSSGGHLTYSGNPRMLMFPSGVAGQRVWPSQADISTISQIEGWWTTSWGSGGGGVTGTAANNPVNH
jgi:hypothetical protein